MQQALDNLPQFLPSEIVSWARNRLVATQALTLSTRAYTAYLPGLSAHARLLLLGRGNTRTRRQA